MIERIYIRNFKSLADFEIKLNKFNCLIGMNGVGKSTVLQAVDFIAQLMVGGIDNWLTMREWSAQELNCKLRSESNIILQVDYKTAEDESIQWECTFNRHELLCSSELLKINGEQSLKVKRQEYRIDKQPFSTIAFNYQGSILSQLKDSELPQAIRQFRDDIRQIRSLELLSPNLLRKRARSTDKDIGVGGEKLSAFLHEIKGDHKKALLELLRVFYPKIVDFGVSSQRSGWKKLTITEQFEDQKLETEARHINDGLLRILAILAQTSSQHSLVLLDEIENGVNPEIIEKLVDTLVNSRQQIIITTHSPMILNYMEDDIARDSVKFLYKNAHGETHTRPFFSIPRIGEKLNYMGAGEAFVDTDMVALTQECVELDEEANFQAGFNK